MRQTKTPIPPQEEPTNYAEMQDQIVSKYTSKEEEAVTDEELPKSYLPRFTDIDLAIQYEKNILQPSEAYWEENQVIKDKYLSENGGDEERAYDKYMEDYINATAEEINNDTAIVEKAQIHDGWAGRFIDQSWFDTETYEAPVWNEPGTLSRRLRIGSSWTEAENSVREAQMGFVEGDSKMYMNDSGELVELKDEETFIDEGWGASPNSLILNPKHTSSDGRMIIAWEYPPADEYSRGPGYLIPVYEGDRPQGEIVSRLDLGDTFLRSNKLDSSSGALAIPRSIARSAIGTATNAIIGTTEAMRSVVSWMDSDNEFLDKTQSFNTMMKSYKMSKYDKDTEKLLTWSNALDLTADVVFQIALAAGTGGASMGLMKAAGFGAKANKYFNLAKAANDAGNAALAIKYTSLAGKAQKLASGVARFNTAFVYSSVAGDGIKEEALQAGFSEKEASTLFLLYMAAVGVIGQSSNLMPHTFNANITNRMGSKVFAGINALPTTFKMGPNKGTWELAKRLAGNVKKAYEKAAEVISESPKMLSMGAAGLEEMFEEQAEFAVELGLKGIFNSYASVTGKGKDIKGFLTIHDPEFWDQVPTEFLLSTVAGFGGGMIGSRLPWTGPNIPENVLPFQGDDNHKLMRIGWEAARGTPRGLAAEKWLFGESKKRLESSKLGTLKYTTQPDPKTGLLMKKVEDPDHLSIGELNYAMIFYQYNKAKLAMMASSAPTFEAFLSENTAIANEINQGDYTFKRYGELYEKLRTKYGDMDPVLLTIQAENPVKPREERGWFKKKKKPSEDDQSSKEVKDEKKNEEEVEKPEADADKKPTVTDSDNVTDEQKETIRKEREEELEAINQEDREEATRLAGALNKPMSDVLEILEIQRELEDMERGLTVERDFIASFIQDNPEQLGALYDKFPEIRDYGPTFINDLLTGDWKRLQEDTEEYKRNQEVLDKVREHISQSSNIDELLNIKHVVNPEDNSLLLDKEALRLWMTSFSEHANQLSTSEEIEDAKDEILVERKLYSTTNPPTEKQKGLTPLSVVLGELNAKFRPVLRQIVKTKDDVKASKLLSLFVDENKEELVKVIQTKHVNRIKSLTGDPRNSSDPGLYYAKIDVSGNSIASYLKQTLPSYYNPNYHAGGFDAEGGLSSTLTPAMNDIAMGRYAKSAQNVEPLFNDKLSIYKNNKIKHVYDKWSGIRMNTKVPPKPGEDIGKFLMREFSLNADEKSVETGARDLFSNRFVIKNQDGTITPAPKDAKPLLNPKRDVLATLKRHGEEDIEGKKVFYDKEGAEALLRQLEVRKAVLSLFAGKVDSESGNPFIGMLAALRTYNAKAYAQQDYYAPLDQDKYTKFSKFYSNYIFDPVDYVHYAKMYVSDKATGNTTLVGKDLERFLEMDGRIAYMDSELLPNVDAAIKEVEELVKASKNVTPEMEFKATYVKSLDEYIKITKRNLEDFLDTREKYGIKLPAKQTKELSTILLDLQSFDPKIADEDDRAAARHRIYDMADILWNLPLKVKKQILLDKNGNPTKGRLHPYVASSYRSFHARLSDVSLPHPPSMDQEYAMFLTDAAVTSYDTEDKLPGLLTAYDRYKYVVYVPGLAGSGKSTIVGKGAVTTSIKEIEHQLDTEGKAGPDKVLLASTSASQLEKLNSSVGDDRYIKKAGDNGIGLTLKEMFTLLGDPKADIKTIIDKLSDVAIIVYDEFTQIEADVSKSDSKSDLSLMLQTLDKVNSSRIGKKIRPIKLIGIGDAKQGGWVTGMAKAADPLAKPDYASMEAKSSNVGDLINTVEVFSTPELQSKFRSKVPALTTTSEKVLEIHSSMSSAAAIASAMSGKDIGVNVDEVLSIWGDIQGDENGRLGGTDFVYSADEAFKDTKFLSNIEKQLESDETFTMVIVHDGIKSGENINSPIADLVNKYPNRVTVESLSTVQGQDYDYALIYTPPGFLKPFGSARRPSDVYTYKLLSMAISRARYFARAVIGSNINFYPRKSDAIHALNTSAAEGIEQRWKDYRDNKLSLDRPAPSPSKTTSKPAKKTVPTTEKVKEEKDKGKVEATSTELNDLSALPTLEQVKEEDKNKSVLDEFNDGDMTSYDVMIEEIDSSIRALQKDDEILNAEEIAKLEEQREAIVYQSDEVPQLQVEGSSNPEEAKALEVISGVSTEEGSLITKAASDFSSLASMLDNEGYIILYTNINKEDDPGSPAESAMWKELYVRDILPGPFMEKEDILHHTRRVFGLTKEEGAIKEYSYKLYTYEYKYKNSMLKTTMLMAEKGGKKFPVARLANKPITAPYSSSVNAKAFVKSREKETEDAWTHVQEIKARNKAEMKRALNNMNWSKFKKKYPGVDVGLTKLSGLERTSALDSKLPSFRYDEETGISMGSVYTAIDISAAVQSGKVIQAVSVGQPVTSSKTIKAQLINSGIISEEEGKNLELGEAGAPIDIDNNTNAQLLDIESIGTLNKESFNDKISHIAFGDGDNAPVPFSFVHKVVDPKTGKKVDKEYTMFIVRSLQDSRIPVYFDGTKWGVFFGISDGELIVNPELEGSSDEKYYNVVVQKLIDSLNRIKKVDDNLAEKKSKEEIAKFVSSTLGFNQAEVDSLKFPYAKFEKASYIYLGSKFNTVGDRTVTADQAKRLIANSYRGVDKDGFQFSEPVVFTRAGKNQDILGRSFFIYTWRTDSDYDLSTDAGIINAMERLGDLSKAVNSGKAIDSVIQRDGFGVVLLDSPAMTFTQIKEKIPYKTSGEASILNKATVSMNSKSAARLQSMLFELASKLREAKLIDIPSSKTKRMDIFLEKYSKDKVLDDNKIRSWITGINTMLDKSNNNEDERGAAKQLLTVISTIVRDSELGVFREEAIPDSVETDPTNKELNLMSDKNGPKLYRSSLMSVMKYYPSSIKVNRDGEEKIIDILKKDKREIDLVALMNLMETKVVQLGEKKRYKVSDAQIKIVYKLMDDIMLKYTLPGKLSRGLFITPGVVKSQGFEASWAKVSGDNLGGSLRTTVKGLLEPAAVASIEALDIAVKNAASKQSKSVITKVKLVKEIDKVKKAAIANINSAGNKEDLEGVHEDFTKAFTNLEKSYIIKNTAQKTVTTITTAAINDIMKVYNSAMSKYDVTEKLKFTTETLATKAIDVGQTQEFLTKKQRDSLIKFSRTLPFITSSADIANAMDKYVKPVTSKLVGKNIDIITKAVMPVVSRIQDDLLTTMNTKEYIDNIVDKVDNGEIEKPPFDGSISDIVDKANSFGIDLTSENRSNIIIAYALATKQNKKALKHVFEAASLSPSSDDFSKSPYIIAKSLLLLLSDNANYKIADAKKLDQWIALESTEEGKAVLDTLLDTHNLKDKLTKEESPTDPDIYQKYEDDIAKIAGDINEDNEALSVAALNALASQLVTNENLTDVQKGLLNMAIEHIRKSIAPESNVKSRVEAYIETLPKAENISKKRKDTFAKMSTYVDKNLSSDPSYSVFIEALGKTELEGVKMEEYQKFMLTILDNLTDNNYPVKDIDSYFTLLGKIINC